MDIKTASLPELRRIAAKIEKEIEKREQADKKGLLNKLKKLAEEQGFDFASLVGLESGAAKPAVAKGKKAEKPAKASKKAAVAGKIKFRHPEDASIGWTGHGRKPGWVINWLADGKPLEELAVGFKPAAGVEIAEESADSTPEANNESGS